MKNSFEEKFWKARLHWFELSSKSKLRWYNEEETSIDHVKVMFQKWKSGGLMFSGRFSINTYVGYSQRSG